MFTEDSVLQMERLFTCATRFSDAGAGAV